jgi:hypothetical protein
MIGMRILNPAAERRKIHLPRKRAVRSNVFI